MPKTAGYEGSQLNDIIDYKYANDKGCETMNMTNDNKNLIQGFMRYFGDMQVSVYRAQGRTELGGNHTDHQNGQVLAAALQELYRHS